MSGKVYGILRELQEGEKELMYELVIITLAIISMIMAFMLGFITSPGEESVATHKSYLKGYEVGYKKGMRDAKKKTKPEEKNEENAEEFLEEVIGNES